MNAPTRVAQITGATSASKPVKILKIDKPAGGQAVTAEASYDGTVKVDFSAIANEKITLVHIGEKLIILFDNQSTVTIIPFFDSMGVPLANITVESDGKEFTGAEFASTFPITTDQSVLPAAGDGAAGTPASGANFANASVDPLLSPDPLPLLPPEVLPPIEFTRIEPIPNAVNLLPGTGPNDPVVIDEDDITSAFSQGIGNTDSPGDDNPINVSGILNFTPGELPTTVDFAAMDGLPVEGTNSLGNTIALISQGHDLVYVWDAGTSTLRAVWADVPDHVVFQIVVEPTTGAYTLTLIDQLDHPYTDNPADPADDATALGFEDNLIVNLVYTVTDGTGDTATGSLSVDFDDDMPRVNGEVESRTVDEDDIKTAWSLGTSPNDGDADGSITEAGTGAAFVSGTLANLVSLGADEHPEPGDDQDPARVFGFTADAIATLEALGLHSKQSTQPATENGLPLTYTTTTDGAWIVLSAFEPDDVPGAPDTGNPVFELRVNQFTGEYEFRLFDELIHVLPPDFPNGSDENFTLRTSGVDALDFGSIITITDYDGDSATLAGSFEIRIRDDVPEADIEFNPLGVVQHDETPGVQGPSFFDLADSDTSSSSVKALFVTLETSGTVGDDPDVAGDTNGAVAGNGAIGYARSVLPLVFNNLLSTEVGADAPAASQTFSLRIVGGDETDSGLTLTDGSHIQLVQEGNLIVGRVVDQLGAVNYVGQAAFAIHVDGNGFVSLAQYLSLQHPDFPDNHDETIDLDGLIEAVLTITDSDGDTDSDFVQIGSQIRFDDDGPDVDVDDQISSTERSQLRVAFDESVQPDGADNDTYDRYNTTETESGGGASNGGVDDVDPAPADLNYNQTPVVETAPDAGEAIGRLVTGVTGGLGALFDVDVDFGADGPLPGQNPARTDTLSFDVTGTGETNLVVTALDGTALEGLSVANRTVFLVEVAPGVVEGRIRGPNGVLGTGSDDHVAFRITVTNPNDPANAQITVEQFLAIDHDASEPSGAAENPENPSLFDENIELRMVGSSTLRVVLTTTATDGDNDSETDSDSVTLISSGTSFISVDDDGPRVTATLTATATLVIHDETPLVQSGTVGTNAYDQDDVSGASLPASILALFNAIGAERGEDPHVDDATEEDNQAIGFARSGAANSYLSYTADFGTDGPAQTTTSQVVYGLQTTNGTFSGLQTTEGADIFLYNGTGALTGLILGRVGTEASATPGADTPNASGSVAFALTADPVTGELFIAQYLSLDHPDAGDGTDGTFDELISLASGTVSAVITVTDGDADKATSNAVDVSSLFGFQDDGPTVAASDDCVDTELTYVGIKAGNVDERGLDGAGDRDVLLSGIGQNNNSINTTNNDIGVGNQFIDGANLPPPSFEPGEILRLDFVNALTFSGTGPTADFNYNGHYEVDSASFTIAQISGNPNNTATVFVQVFDANDDEDYTNDGDPLPITLADVTISGDATFTKTAIYNAGGDIIGIVIEGLDNGATVTVDTADDFDRLVIRNFDNETALIDDQGTEQTFTGGSPFSVSGIQSIACLPVTLSVTHDESAGFVPQSGPNPEDDVDPATAPATLTTAIATAGIASVLGFAKSGSSASTLFGTPDFGSDGPAAANATQYQLSTAIAGGQFTGQDSGLNTTTGDADILLYSDPDNPSIVWGVANGDLDTGDRVFALFLDATGFLWVAQFQAIAHDVDGDTPADHDDIASITGGLVHVTVTITDGDGDFARAVSDSGLVIDFQDDGPRAVSEPDAIQATIFEDALSTAAEPSDQSEGNREGQTTNDDTESGVAGSLNSLFEFGTDAPLTFSLSADTSGLPTLFSKGEAVSYSVTVDDGGTGSDPTDDVSTLTATAGSRTVFTLVVNADGSWTFDLDDQLDHVDAGGDLSLLLKASPNDAVGVGAIDFSSIVVATDADGDFVTGAATGSFTVTIENDVPIRTTASILRTVDEDDIDTPWSEGTSPNDGDADGSTTENATGAAFVSGTLSSLVSIGADETANGDPVFGFTSTAVDQMLALGLYSKQSTQPATENGLPLTYTTGTDGSWLVLSAFEPDTPGPSNTGNPVFELRINQFTGAYEFRLFDELIHQLPPGFPNGADENFDLRSGEPDPVQATIPHLDFGSIITVTDHDGDQVALDGGFLIRVRDDIPDLDIDRTDESVTHDETPGDDGADDESFGNLPSSAQTAFSSVTDTANDPDVPSVSLGAIGFAHDDDSVVFNDFGDTENGADSPPASAVFSLAIVGGDGVDSGLDTTEGFSIFLFQEGSGLIVGRVQGGSFDGQAAFAVHINQSGEVSVAQWLSLRHDDRGDLDESNDNGTNANDSQNPNDSPEPIQQTLDGKINAVLTITDSDGDSVSDSVGIGERIVFQDDGPDFTELEADEDLTHDETPDLQDDDVALASVPAAALTAFAAVASAGDDPHVPPASGPIGYAVSTGSLVDVQVDYGSDGQGAPLTYQLTLDGNNLHSGLFTTDGRDIHLFKEGNIVVGRYEVGGNNIPDGSADEPAAFAIHIDPATGQVTVVQYVSLFHPDEDASDDQVDIDGGLLFVGVTAVDGDGDPLTDYVDIGSRIEFDDDAPSATFTLQSGTSVVHDETVGVDGDANDVATNLSALFAAVSNKGNDPHESTAPETEIGYAQSAGPIVTVSANFGADGPAAGGGISYAFDIPGSSAASGLFTTEGLPITLFQVNSRIIVGRFDGPDSGTTVGTSDPAAFAIDIDPATGVVTVVQYVSLRHDDRGDPDEANDNGTDANDAQNPNDSPEPIQQAITTNALQIIATVTDGDDDQVSQTFNVGNKIVFQDDGPTLDVTAATGTALNALTLNVDETDDAAGTDRTNPVGPEAADNANPDGNAGVAGLGTVTTNVGGGLISLFSLAGDAGTDGQTSLTGAFKFLFTQAGPLATNLTATDNGAIVLDLSDDGQAITGRDLADNSTVFTISIVDVGGGVMQLRLTQFQAIDHDAAPGANENPDLFDEVVSLLLSGAGAVQLQYEATRTDGDGDAITDSAQINLITSGTSYFSFDDDGPISGTVSISGAASLIHDETFGDDGDDDIAGSLAVFDPITNKGDDLDVAGTGPIGFAQDSSWTIVSNANYGSDGQGPAVQYSLTLSAAGVFSGLKTTAGFDIDLSVEDYAGTKIVVGRVDGGTDNGKAAFAIHVDPATGALSLVQYLSIQHDDVNDHDEANDDGTNAGDDAPDQVTEPIQQALANGTLSLTATFTDGDGDSTTASTDISSRVRFEDDGPVITGVTQDDLGVDQLANGNFTDPAGTTPTSWGFIATSIAGWSIAGSPVDPANPLQFEIVNDGYLNMSTPGQLPMLDMGASPGNIEISQTIAGLTVGQGFTLEFYAGAPFPETATLQVWWNGQLIDTIEPGATMQLYSYSVTAGGGNDVLKFVEIGLGSDPIPNLANEGYHGTYLAGVSVKGAAALDDEDTTLNPAVEIQGGPGDDGAGIVATGKINFDPGSDGLKSIALGAIVGLTGIFVDDNGVGTSYAIDQVWHAGKNAAEVAAPGYEQGGTLIGTMATPEGPQVAFTIEVKSDGTYTFTLIAPLNHPLQDDGNPQNGVETSWEDNLNLNFQITVTDGDNDTATGTLAFVVDDDSPVITNVTQGIAYGGELIVNGSFESGHGLVGTDWEIFSSITGWMQDPNGPPFEVQTGGAGGLAAQSGNALIELDSDTTGNPSNPLPDVNPTEDTNATIQQVVVGTEAGQTYELSFYYAPRAGAEGSSGMEVFFGGLKVFDTDDQTLQSGWQKITIQVTAPSDDALLQFVGTGTQNELGALLDNVSMRAVQTQIVDDEDTSLSPAVEIQGGPGDDGAGVVLKGLIDFDAGADGLKSIAIGAIAGLTGIFVDDNGVGQSYAIDQVWNSGENAAGVAADGYENGGTLVGTMDTPEGVQTAFTIEVDSNGIYTFTLIAPLNHPLQDDGNPQNGVETSWEDNLNLNFQITVTDGDNDTATGTLAIGVDDDSPKATGSANVTVDEGDISGGGFNSTPLSFDFTGTNGQPPNLGLNLSVNAGSVVAQFGFTEFTLQGPPANTGALPIVFTALNGTTFTVDSVAIGLFGANSGASQVTLNGYDAGGNLIATYVFASQAVAYAAATPSTVFDSTGTPFDNLAIAKLEIVPPPTLAGRIILDNLNVVQNVPNPIDPAEVSVDLVPLAIFGADGKHAAAAFQLKVVNTPADFGDLTAGGQEVVVQTINGVLVGHTGDPNQPAFTLEIVNGQAVFKLYADLDHGNNELLSLDFTNYVFAVDGDGDAIPLPVVINVDGDTPFQQIDDFTGAVEEEHLNPGLAHPAGTPAITAVGIEDTEDAGAEEDLDTVLNLDITTNDKGGDLTLLFTGGDGALTYGFNVINGTPATFVGGATVLSSGQTVYLAVNSGNPSRLWGFTNTSGSTASYDAGDHAVFVIDLNSSGQFTFTLLDQIDHHPYQASPVDNLEGTQTLDLGGVFKVTDAQSDELVFNNVTIAVIDDIPDAAALAGSASATLDESLAVPLGDGDGVNPATIAAATIAALFAAPAYGSDGPGAPTYKLTATDNATTGLWPTGQSDPADEIRLDVVSDTQIDGRVGGGGTLAFTIAINATTGEVTVTQFATLEHGSDGPEGAAHDDGALLDAAVSVVQRVTDGDGDFDEATSASTLAITFQDDGPDADINLSGTPVIIVDESIGQNAGETGEPGNLGSVTVLGTALFSSAHQFGADGAAVVEPVSYQLVLSAAGVDSGLDDTATGNSIFLFNEAGVIRGREGTNAGDAVGGDIVFTVSVNGSGDVTVTQLRAIVHDDVNDHDEANDDGTAGNDDGPLDDAAIQQTIANGALLLQATVTDGDGDFDTDSIDLGALIRFEDAGPDVVALAGSASATLDESLAVPLGDGDGVNPATIAAATIAALFAAPAYGSDGPGAPTYKLTATDNVTTGLWLTGQSDPADEIRLDVVSDTQIDGRVGGGGTLAFTIAINATTGEVTVTQFATLEHGSDGPEGAAHDDGALLDAAVSVVQRVTDGDGDFEEATSANALAITFQDDGPDADINLSGTPVIIVDESIGQNAGETGEPGNLGSVTVLGSALFSSAHQFGADGGAVVEPVSYQLVLSAAGVDSSLDDTATGNPIFLFDEAGVIRGREGTDALDAATGDIVFEVSVNGSGDVTVTQLRAIVHDDVNDHDEANDDGTAGNDAGPLDDAAIQQAIANGALLLQATVTDGDGDFDTDSIDLGALIRFEDAGPTAQSATGTVFVDDEGVAVGNLGGVGDADVEGALDGDTDGAPDNDTSQATNKGTLAGLFNAGSDGLKSLDLAVNTGAVSVVNELGATIPLTSDGAPVAYVWDAGTNTLFGRTTAASAEALAGTDVFSIELLTSGGAFTGQFKVTLFREVDHPLTDNPATAGTVEISYEDNLVLNLVYRVTDGDNDFATGSFSVTIDDDTPVLEADDDTNTHTVENLATSPLVNGDLTFSVGADDPAGVGAITLDTTPGALTSGGAALIYDNATPNVLIAHTGNPLDPVFTLTVDPVTKTYTFDLDRPLDGAVVDNVLIGGAFGAGPTNFQILSTGAPDNTHLATVSGWKSNGGGFNLATWKASAAGDAGVVVDDVNGGTNGWGVDNQNFNTGEILRFDFGQQVDFDEGSAYVPPAPGTFNGEEVSKALFNFAGHSAGDTIHYAAQYTDGTRVSGSFDVGTLTGDNFEHTAPLGKFINYIEFYAEDSTGSGKVDLVSVSIIESNVDIDLDFDVTIEDSDGDGIVIPIHIDVKEPAPTTVADTVITNFGLSPATIAIPEWALVANDIDPDNGALDVTGVGGASGGTVSHTAGSGNAGTATFTDTPLLDGSFTYQATNGSQTGTAATVTVDNYTPATNTLTGGGGAEILISAGNGDVLIGNGGNDVLIGNGGNDVLLGGDGDDILIGGAGDEAVEGGAGNDSIFIADVLADGENISSVRGGTGFDRLLIASSPANNITFAGAATVTGAFSYVNNSIETIVGDGSGSGSTLTGTGAVESWDFFRVNMQNVDVDMAGGSDVVNTSTSHQGATVYTGGGGGGTNDTIVVAFTGDQLSEILNDTTFRGEITNFFDGSPGAGLDLDASSWSADVSGFELASLSVSYGIGLLVFGTPLPGTDSSPDNDGFGDFFIGDGTGQIMNGGGVGSGIGVIPDNQINGSDVILGLGGNDTIYGGAGDDMLDGGADDDTLNGGDGIDILLGGAGTDTLNGGNNADLMFGNDGTDILSGGAGDDILVGGLGADDLTGGAGADRFVLDNVGAIDDILDYETGDVVDLTALLNVAAGTNLVTAGYINLVNGSPDTLQIDLDGGGDDFVNLATVAYSGGPGNLVLQYLENGVAQNQSVTIP